MEPDQHQAQVLHDVEEASRPQGQATTSTSGAAYELETSGDGEVQQMAASQDDTADLFGSPLQETSGDLEVSLSSSSDSESYQGDRDASDNETQDLGGTGTAEDGAGGTERAAAHNETIDGSAPAISAESTATTTDGGSEVDRGASQVPIDAVHGHGHREGDENIEQGAQVGPAGSSVTAGVDPGRRLASVIMGSAGADPTPSSSDDDLMECQDHAGAALSGFSPVAAGRTASGHRSLLQAAEDSVVSDLRSQHERLAQEVETRFEQTNSGLSTLMSMVGQLLGQQANTTGAGAAASDESAKAGVGHRRPDADSPQKPTKVPRQGPSPGPISAAEANSQVSGRGQVGSDQVEPVGIDGGHPVTDCDDSVLNVGDPNQNKETSADSTSTGRSTPSSTFSTGRSTPSSTFSTGRSTSSPSHATASTPTATGLGAERGGVQAILTGSAPSGALPLGDAAEGSASQANQWEAEVVSHGLSPSTSEVGPAGGTSCVAGPSVNDPAATHMVGTDEMDESHLRPLPRTNPQEAPSADSRSVLPSAGAGPIDASPASGSDRPRSRAGPHGDMRGGTEDAGMGVALPPAPPTPRGEVLKSGGVDHSGKPALRAPAKGWTLEQEPAQPGGAVEKSGATEGAPSGDGGIELVSPGLSPARVPGGPSTADTQFHPVRHSHKAKSTATNKAHTPPISDGVAQHTSSAQVESLSASDEDTVPVPGKEEQRLAEALAASAADAGHEAEESTQPHQDGERQWHAVRVTVMTETRLALGVHRDPATNQRRFD